MNCVLRVLLTSFHFVPSCEIVFVRKDLLFIHEEYHHRISNFYCLPKHLIYLSYIEEEKKLGKNFAIPHDRKTTKKK